MNVAWLLRAIQYVEKLEGGIEAAWPTLKNMIDEAKQLVLLLNNNKTPAMAFPGSSEATEALQRLKAAGVSEQEARDALAIVEALDQRTR